MAADPLIPLIDPRDEGDVWARLKALVPYYIPGWEVKNGDAGTALAKIFSRMVGMIIQRLNRVPSKNFSAFLETLGIELLAPESAQAPVTFFLPQDADKHVQVPVNTQTTAGEVIFETRENLLATPARLMKVYSTFPGKDEIYEIPPSIYSGEPHQPLETPLVQPPTPGEKEIFLQHPGGLKKDDRVIIKALQPGNTGDTFEMGIISEISGTRATLVHKLEKEYPAAADQILLEKLNKFSLDKGKNLQNHILYIGHGDVLNLKGSYKVILEFSNSKCSILNYGHLANPNYVTWQYYGKDSEGEEDWHEINAVYEKERIELTPPGAGGEITETGINGLTSRWIRCRVKDNQINEVKNIDIQELTLASSQAAGKTVETGNTLDAAFHNDIPLDLTIDKDTGQFKEPLLPFGEKPMAYDTFYMGSREIFSKKGAHIILNFSIIKEESPISIKEESPKEEKDRLKLSWEYWNGNGWVSLVDVDDETDQFRKKGNNNVSFTCPSELEALSVNGQENHWLRVRIACGDYGKEKYKYDETTRTYLPDDSDIHPPVFNMITLSYQYKTSQPAEYCLSLNNLEYENYFDSSLPFQPFKPLEDADTNGWCFYLGYNKKIEMGPIRLFFSFEETEMLLGNLPQIQWYYSSSTGKKWNPLEVTDNTGSLTLTGSISFYMPPDFHEIPGFGETYYWLKAVINEDAIISCSQITGIYINTVYAAQGESIDEEILGSSSLDPRQTFQHQRFPVIKAQEQVWVNEAAALVEKDITKLIARYGKEAVKIEKDSTGKITAVWVKWQRVSDFFDSKPDSRYYVSNFDLGQVTFGDGISGMIPPAGKDNIKSSYRVGGGNYGNVKAYEISVLKSPIPAVERVFNSEAASGGSDEENPEAYYKRAPQVIRHRGRAVSKEDFQRIAKSVSASIAKTLCYVKNSYVYIIILPKGEEKKPIPTSGLKKMVKERLLQCCLDTLPPDSLQMINPKFRAVRVTTRVVPKTMDIALPLREKILNQLNRFLHPISGGFERSGWDFGRGVYQSDIYTIIEEIPGVDHVETLTLTTQEKENQHMEAITIKQDEAICSGQHKVTIIPGRS